MARKRMLDPGLWDSEQVQQLTDAQFKMYIYLISSSDDEGRFKVNFKMIAAKAMPLQESYQAAECQNDIVELHKDGLISLYTDDDGNIYGAHPNWTRYQKINRPQPSHIPAPEGLTPFTERSVNDHGTITERSLNDHGTFTPNRIERNRIEEKGIELADADAPAPNGGLSPLKDELANQYQDAFTSETPASAWANIGRERKAITNIAEWTRRLSAGTGIPPEDLAPKILKKFNALLRTERASFWKTASFTPSSLAESNRWNAVVDALKREYAEPAEVIF